MAIMRLIDYAGGIISKGKITFDGEELTTKQAKRDEPDTRRAAGHDLPGSDVRAEPRILGRRPNRRKPAHPKGMNAKDAWIKP